MAVLLEMAHSPYKTESTLKAKSALLALCLSEDKLNYLRNKVKSTQKSLGLIFSVFNDLDVPENRKNVVGTMYQLSQDCLQHSLMELYQAMIPALVKVLDDKSEDIIFKALETLDYLALRDDLQVFISKAGAVHAIIKKYKSMTIMNGKIWCVEVLALLSNNDIELLNKKEYIMFFVEVQREMSDHDAGLFNDSHEDSNYRERMLKIARLTLAGASENFVQSDLKKKMKFVATECRNSDPVLACKAAGTFGVLASDYRYRPNLVKAGMVEELVTLIKHENVAVVTQACKAIYNFTRGHEGMELWFKFDSSYVYDAANLHILSETIECVHLPGDKGIYSNWGMVFDKSNRIEVQDMPFLDEWTLACWFTWPLPKSSGEERSFESGYYYEDHVLVQGTSMVGGFVVFRNDAVGAYDQITGQFVTLWNNLSQLKKGWHFLAVTKNSGNKMQAYIDGQQKVKLISTVSLNEPMRNFCNDFSFNHGMGAIADLRVYRRALPYSDIKSISKYTENVFDGMADKYIEYINIAEGPLQLINQLKADNQHVKIPAVMALANLATKSSCRASIVRSGGVPILISLLGTPTPTLKFHVARALVNMA